MVEILSGENVRLKVVEDNKYTWDNIQFEFAEIYQIEHTNHGGIQDCVWKVNGRIFTDLSCLQGDLIKDFTTDRNDCLYRLKKYSDGTKFLFYREEIPTFDDGDREWDSMKYRAVYCDNRGVNLIHCHEGYRLARINICVGMKKVSKEFFRWLIYIGCPFRMLPKKYL